MPRCSHMRVNNPSTRRLSRPSRSACWLARHVQRLHHLGMGLFRVEPEMGAPSAWVAATSRRGSQKGPGLALQGLSAVGQ